MIGLHFGDPLFAASYVAFACVTSLGVYQWATLRAGRDWPGPVFFHSRPAAGALAGLLLVVAGYGGFFGLRWDYVMVPGLAGWELLIAFGTGALIALGIALLSSAIFGG